MGCENCEKLQKELNEVRSQFFIVDELYQAVCKIGRTFMKFWEKKEFKILLEEVHEASQVSGALGKAVK